MCIAAPPAWAFRPQHATLTTRDLWRKLGFMRVAVLLARTLASVWSIGSDRSVMRLITKPRDSTACAPAEPALAEKDVCTCWASGFMVQGRGIGVKELKRCGGWRVEKSDCRSAHSFSADKFLEEHQRRLSMRGVRHERTQAPGLTKEALKACYALFPNLRPEVEVDIFREGCGGEQEERTPSCHEGAWGKLLRSWSTGPLLGCLSIGNGAFQYGNICQSCLRTYE